MWDELRKDGERMEEIAIKLGDRQDIWQDRYIYWIAKALYDTIRCVLHLRRGL